MVVSGVVSLITEIVRKRVGTFIWHIRVYPAVRCCKILSFRIGTFVASMKAGQELLVYHLLLLLSPEVARVLPDKLILHLATVSLGGNLDNKEDRQLGKKEGHKKLQNSWNQRRVWLCLWLCVCV